MSDLLESTLICRQFLTDAQCEELETKLGTKFNQRALLAQAVTHKSCHVVINGKVIIQSNEKLEHLGDKVIGLAVCRFLHTKYPEENEGFYSQILPSATSNNTLGDVGISLELGRFLVTHDTATAAALSKSVQADMVEAIVAALFFDQGLEAVDRFLSQCLYPRVDELVQEKKRAA